jgi:hypothetical protein
MRQSLPELIHAARLALSEAVRPELTSDHAHAQLAGVLDILAKLERMVVWSPEALGRRLQKLQEGCDAFVVRLAEEGVSLPSYAPRPGASIEEAMLAGEERLMQLIDWMFEPGHSLSMEARRALDGILQQTLRQELVIERKLIPLTDFTAMSSAAASAKA